MDGGYQLPAEIADAEDPVFHVAVFGVERTKDQLVIHVLNRDDADLGLLFTDDVVRIPLRDDGMDEMDYFGRATAFIERELEGTQAAAGPRSLHEAIGKRLGFYGKAAGGGMALVVPMWRMRAESIQMLRTAPDALLSVLVSAVGTGGLEGSGCCLTDSHFGCTMEAVRHPMATSLSRERDMIAATVINVADETAVIPPEVEFTGWRAAPVIVNLEWQGKLPVEALGERDLRDLMNACAHEEIECGWKRVEAAFRAHIAGAIENPIVFADNVDVSKAASTAPLSFTNGTEEDFQRAMEWLLILNAALKGPATRSVAFNNPANAVLFASFLGFPFADILVIEAGGDNAVGQPYSQVVAGGEQILAEGLIEILEAMLAWYRPMGTTIRKYTGNRGSDAVIGPVFRAYEPLDRDPAGHETMEAVAGLTFFLGERGWTPERIASAIGSK